MKKYARSGIEYIINEYKTMDEFRKNQLKKVLIIELFLIV